MTSLYDPTFHFFLFSLLLISFVREKTERMLITKEGKYLKGFENRRGCARVDPFLKKNLDVGGTDMSFRPIEQKGKMDCGVL